jgi:RNA-binding protein
VSTLRGKDRAALRAEAHHLAPAVQMGAQGITETVVKSLEDTLRARQLVKVKIGKGGELPTRQVANELAARTGAEVIQIIGRTFTLYRKAVNEQ